MVLSILGIIISMIGAISGLQWLGRRWGQYRLRSNRRKQIAAMTPRPYRYRSIEWSAKVGDEGRDWIVVWTPTIVATTESIDGIRLSLEFAGEDPSSYEESVEPSSIAIEIIDGALPTKQARFFRFPQAVAPNRECTFTYTRRFRKPAPPRRDIFLGRSHVSCGCLAIRVVFAGWAPGNVRYQISKANTQVIESKRVTIDALSGEVGHTIRDVDASLTYGFAWQYDGKNDRRVLKYQTT